MSTWRQVISLLTLKIEFQTTYVNIFKKKSCLFFTLFLIEINDSPFVSMSTQQSERVSHDRAVSFSSRGLSYSYTQRYYYYVQRKKRDLSRWKIFILSISIRVCKGKMCTSTYDVYNNLHVPAALIRRFISLLSERKETAADLAIINACKCRQSYFIFTETNV